MKTHNIFYLISLFLIILSGGAFVLTNTDLDDQENSIHVALRNVGHELLLENNDTTSLIFPIQKLNEDEFQISFYNELSLLPEDLVHAVKNNLTAANIGPIHNVQVFTCDDQNIVYSYQITEKTENTIIPCSGRKLPLDCYFINVQIHLADKALDQTQQLSLYGTLVFILLGLLFSYRAKKVDQNDSDLMEDFISIGNYKFYQAENKLVRNQLTIELSAKECELITIFSIHQNQVIKRETLVKKVWEDNGVIVGRSLDTYISKIRKKFIDDDSINLVNVHGVGYKLEVK